MVCATSLAALMLVGAGPPTPEPFSDLVPNNFCVSRDGKRLAMDGWQIWDIPSRKKILEGKSLGFTGMDFSPDGRFFACGGNYAYLHVFDARTGKLHWDLTLKHGDTVLTHIEFTPDGRHLVSAATNGTIRVWDVRGKKAVALFCFPSAAWYNQESQDDYLAAWRALVGKDRNPDDVKTFVKFKQPIKHLRQFSISPDGKTVAVYTDASEVLILELATGKILKTLDTKVGSAYSLRFSPDGRTLAVGGGGGSGKDKLEANLDLWDVASGKRLWRRGADSDTVLWLAFSPDGKILASGGHYDGARVWEAATGKLMYQLHERKKDDWKKHEYSHVIGVAFLPDGKALLTLPATRWKGAVHFWEPTTGKRIPQPLGE